MLFALGFSESNFIFCLAYRIPPFLKTQFQKGMNYRFCHCDPRASPSPPPSARAGRRSPRKGICCEARGYYFRHLTLSQAASADGLSRPALRIPTPRLCVPAAPAKQHIPGCPLNFALLMKCHCGVAIPHYPMRIWAPIGRDSLDNRHPGPHLLQILMPLKRLQGRNNCRNMN